MFYLFDFFRKRPLRRGAYITVRSIFDAVVQVVGVHGMARLTMRKVADVAGVSVGAIYQYFLTKENMIIAMVCFEVDRVIFGLDALLKKPHPTNDLEALVKDYIHFLVTRLAMGDAYRQSMLKIAWSMNDHPQLQMRVQQVSQAFFLHVQHVYRIGPITPVHAFVLSNAVLGVIRAVVLEEQQDVDFGALEAQLVKLSMSMLCTEAG